MSQPTVEAKFAISALKEEGERLASQAQRIIATEVKRHASSQTYFPGIKVRVVPSAEVKWRTAKPATATQGGKAVGAIALYFEGKARVKVDLKLVVGTRKLGAIETRQMVQILIVPRVTKGKISSKATVRVIEATAKKERRSKQSQADALRKFVSKEIVAKITQAIGKKELLPGPILALGSVNKVTVGSTQVVATLGIPGNGFAADAASKASKVPPKLKP